LNIGNRKVFLETEIEAHSSVKFTENCGSFFGIVGFSDKSFDFCSEIDVESKYVDDGSLKCIRTGNPWKQLLHDYHFFLILCSGLLRDLSLHLNIHDKQLSEEVDEFIQDFFCEEGVTFTAKYHGLLQIIEIAVPEYLETFGNDEDVVRLSKTLLESIARYAYIIYKLIFF